jgi:hypothetical protein
MPLQVYQIPPEPRFFLLLYVRYFSVRIAYVGFLYIAGFGNSFLCISQSDRQEGANGSRLRGIIFVRALFFSSVF